MHDAPGESELELRYKTVVAQAEEWMIDHNRPQSWVATELGVERSVLSRFLGGDSRYRPTPRRKKMLSILEGLERLCVDQTRDIFLSHRSCDKEIVRRLAERIESTEYGGKKLTVWLDEAEIRPGQSIPAMVNRGIELSKFVAIVMSPNYFEQGSGWTDAEWHSALHTDPDNRKGKILPLLVEDCPYVPALLRHLLMIDLRNSRFDTGLEQLIRVLKNEPLPRPVEYRGQLIHSDGSIDRATLLAERAVPEADPDVVSERLYCNLLPIQQLPQSIYFAPILDSLKKRVKGKRALPSKKRLIEEIYSAQDKQGKPKWLPKFRTDGQGILTFHDLEDSECPLQAIVDSNAVEVFDTQEFVSDANDRRIIVSLLNMSISRRLFGRGLKEDPNRYMRFFFPPKDNSAVCIDWVAAKRKATRTVTKPYMKNGEQDGWMHHACKISVTFLASRFYVQLTPTRLLTVDGKQVRRGPRVGSVVTRWLAQERNLHVLYNVRFWTCILGDRGGPITIAAGDQRMVIGKVPALMQQAYGISGDQRDLLGDLDNEAERLSRLENELPENDESDEFDAILEDTA